MTQYPPLTPTRIQWNCPNKEFHYAAVVHLSKSQIDRATAVATRKSPFVNIHSPGGLARDQSIMHSRIVAGKLADYAVLTLLTRRVALLNMPVELIEYDNVRSDDFKQPDLFDIQVKAAATFDVEVRSSFCYKVADPAKIPSTFSIYGWYVTGNKPIEPKRPYYWQVVYHMRPSDVEPAGWWPRLPIFEKEVANGSVDAYVVGGATRDMLDDVTLARVRADQDGAKYQSISPICNGLDVERMLRVTLSGLQR
jgi:hypothetical protein